MRHRHFWRTVGVLTAGLMIWPLSISLAGEAETKATAPAETKAAPEMPAGLAGTVIAVIPSSRTLVVDVPLGREVLRIGAEVTDTTKITVKGQAVPLDHLKAGDKVRINFRRIPTGNEAISVEVLPNRKR